MKFNKILFFLLFFVMQEIFSFSTVYFVAKYGNDLNDGLTVDTPFATIQKAASLMQPGDTCYVRNGVYREEIIPANSGAQNAPIVFMPYFSESVTISGADILNLQWEIYNGSIYKANTTETFIQLFIDSKMANEARWPNADPNNLVNMPMAICDNGTNANTLVDDALPDGNWENAYVHITPGYEWVSWTRKIINYIPHNSFNFSSPVGTDSNYYPKQGNRYYLFGALAGLDSPDEWFLDDNNDTIYLWCNGNDSPQNHLIEIKKRNYAFNLSGKSYIVIYGFNIFAAAIFMNNSTSHCEVNCCYVKYVDHSTSCEGYSGISRKNQMAGTYNEWKNSIIEYSATDGIYVRGSYNKVTNCLIHDVDYLAVYAAAIHSDGAMNCVFSNNTLYNSGRFLFYHPLTKASKFLFNEIYNGGLLTYDYGGTYCWQTNGESTEIAYNWVHDNHSYLGIGIYLDNGSSNHIVHHNVVWNCNDSGIRLNTPSTYNLIYNNTLLNNKDSINYWGSPEDQTGTKVINNLGNNSFLFVLPPNPTPEAHHNGNFPVDSNFVPLPGSITAVDAGVEISGITDGYVGSAPDIGAYEYGGNYFIPGYKTPTETMTVIPGIGTPTFTPTVNITPVSTSEGNLEISEIKIYPVPFSFKSNDNLKIEFNLNNECNQAEIKVYTITFRLITNLIINKDFKPGRNSILIKSNNLWDLSNGLYFLKIGLKSNNGKSAKSKIQIIILNK